MNDVSLAEGDPPARRRSRSPVTLVVAAGAGGRHVRHRHRRRHRAGRQPGDEDNDYVAQSLTGQTIPAGLQPYTFDVTVNGDTTVEPNETFFVNVTNITGATAGDAQGLGTIATTTSLTPIHDIQGAGATSPLVGSVGHDARHRHRA